MSKSAKKMPLKWKRGLSSFLLALFLCLFCYLSESIPFSVGEPIWQFFVIERLIQENVGKKDQLDEGFFINVGYDKVIADISLYNGLFTGSVAITDRQALDDLLRRLQEDDTYKYIFLDVRLEKGINTPQDSQLFHRISQMRDIVIADHHEIELASPVLQEKAALSDYKMATYSTGFSRYQFLQGDRETAPLRIYRDITGNSIRKVGFLPFYASEGKPCQNTLFIRIPVDFSNRRPNREKMLYYDYGAQIVEDFPLKTLTNGKYVIIGDYVEDKSGTYLGEQPNPYIAYLATLSLLRGYHIYRSLFIIFVFVLFWWLSWFAIQGKQPSITLWLMSLKGKRIKNVYVRWFLSFFSYGFYLSIACLVFFLIWKTTFSIFFSSLILTLVTNAGSIRATNDEE